MLLVKSIFNFIICNCLSCVLSVYVGDFIYSSLELEYRELFDFYRKGRINVTTVVYSRLVSINGTLNTCVVKCFTNIRKLFDICKFYFLMMNYTCKFKCVNLKLDYLDIGIFMHFCISETVAPTLPRWSLIS